VIRRALFLATPLLAALLLLGGCDANQDELRTWMEQVRKTTPPSAQKVDEPRIFQPFRYDDATLPDPFSLAKMNAMMERAGVVKGGSAPDLRRPREVLESFGLDQVKLVGHLRRAGKETALVQVERLVYQVRVGNHIGQDFGKVTRITENEVTLKELVQDASGAWVGRETVLQLQEKQP